MKKMYDSNVAADIPITAQLVAGYIDGQYAWSPADWARFPGAQLVRIAVFATTDAGDVLNVEPPTMPTDAPGWVEKRRAAGHSWATCYVNEQNDWQPTRDAFTAAGIAEPLWWVANYDNVAAIPAGAVAKQYANPPLTGGHYDASVTVDAWPGVPAPVPAPPSEEEEAMPPFVAKAQGTPGPYYVVDAELTQKVLLVEPVDGSSVTAAPPDGLGYKVVDLSQQMLDDITTVV